MIHRLRDMIGDATCGVRIRLDDVDGRKRYGWARAVPLPFFGGLLDRLRDAWAVIQGDAYAVVWPEPGELERALRRGLFTRNEIIEEERAALADLQARAANAAVEGIACASGNSNGERT